MKKPLSAPVDEGNFRLAHWATMQARTELAWMMPSLRRAVRLTFGPGWEIHIAAEGDAGEPVTIAFTADQTAALCRSESEHAAAAMVHELTVSALRADGYWWAGMAPLINVARAR